MSDELIWFNGEVMPMAEARVGVEDRGFQFADGVYEVVRFYNGRLFTLTEHLDRLGKSSADLQIPLPIDRQKLAAEMSAFVTRSGLLDGMIYLQLTRGPAERSHVFPDVVHPTLLFYVRPLPKVPPAGTAEGTKLHSVVDDRWSRCWIKSIALLANTLAKSAAVDADADEAVFITDGVVTECAASNFFAVIDGQLITHPVGPKVLPGITRQVLHDLCKHFAIPFVERALVEQEARSAAEVFITSTTRELSWVSQWNGQPIAQKCGPITLKLHRAYQERVKQEIIGK